MFAKQLILFGSLVLFIGLFLYAYDNVPLIGKLRGDFLLKKGNMVIYIPLMTSLVMSFILTIIFNIIKK